MPRKRTDIVTESRAQLLDLERRSSGSRRLRVKSLRLIKERPKDSLSQIANAVGVSATALDRWWATYRHGGLEALLETRQRGGYRPSKVDDTLIEVIRRKREVGELGSQSDVQRWLLQEHSITVSRSGVGYLLKRVADAEPLSQESHAQMLLPDSSGSSIVEQGLSDSQQLHMLTSLRRYYDTASWVQGFRELMSPHLRDVTRISADINTECDLLNPVDYVPDLIFSQSLGVALNEQDVFVTAAKEKGGIAQYVIKKFAAQGAPLDQSHPPVWREYYYEGTAYLGSIFLWRDIGRPPISAATIEFVDRLEPFITLLLSDIVIRYNYARPRNRVFHDILNTGLSSIPKCNPFWPDSRGWGQ